ncbi:MAG: hypothetical protein ABIT20_18400 [Gemmatimonadaceae bacterium]
MLKSILVGLTALCVITVPVAAQVAAALPMGAFGEKPMDPAQMAALFANAQRTMKPASYVLSHKSDLALTDDQVQRLEVLSRAQDDSVIVRQIRMTSAMHRRLKERLDSGTAPQFGWVGSVDEKKFRDEACEQAGISTEYAIGMMRDRLAVGSVLTGTQIDRLPQLEASDAMRAMKPKTP